MKNTIFLAFIAAALFTACKKSDVTDTQGNAQVIPAASVPAAVVNTFNSMFSGASEVEWQREDNRFGVQFNHSSSRRHSRFDDSGHHVSTSDICTDGPVPAAVLNAFRARFPNDNVYQWKLMTDGNWKPHFMRGTVKWEAIITPAGNIIKVEHD
ncbi:MAG: hypothetical protein JNM68_01170 [Dinghuibacter sp.]|nr:hypothetical protein [Dinghuibacter sp.]